MFNEKPVATDFELKCIRGKGHLSSSHMLRNFALRSRWQEVFEAAADRIDELEKQLKAKQ